MILSCVYICTYVWHTSTYTCIRIDQLASSSCKYNSGTIQTFTFCNFNSLLVFFLFFFSGKREITRGENSTANCSNLIGASAINNTVGYDTAPGGANMIPDDTAPDEDFAVAITQKTQVRQILA